MSEADKIRRQAETAPVVASDGPKRSYVSRTYKGGRELGFKVTPGFYGMGEVWVPHPSDFGGMLPPGTPLTLHVSSVPVEGHTLYLKGKNSAGRYTYGTAPGRSGVTIHAASMPQCPPGMTPAMLVSSLRVSAIRAARQTVAIAVQAAPVAAAAIARPWTPPELELVVKDYFAMLDEEDSGGADQAAHNRALIALLQNRTMDTVESIRAQISQVLVTQGLPYIDRYQPGEQAGPPVELLVLACVDAAPAAPQPVAETTPPTTSPAPSTDFDHVHRLVEAPPPPAQTEREGRAGVRSTVMGIDYPLRDAKNCELGRVGEQSVVEYERRRLVDEEHRPDLAEQVEWVAQTRGDGLGYDVLSFDGDGLPRLIEVKTTNLSDNTPFLVTRNEVDVSVREGTRYYLYRVFAFNSNPRVFTLPGPLTNTCVLTPTVFSARVR